MTDQAPEIRQYDVDFDDLCGAPGTVELEVRRGFVLVTLVRDDSGEEVGVALNPRTALSIGEALTATARRLQHADE